MNVGYRGPGGGGQGPRPPGAPGGGGGFRPTGQGQEQFVPPSGPDLRAIIVEGDAQRLVAEADRLGKALAQTLTTSQVRNVFATVRQIEMSWPLEGSAQGDGEQARARRCQRELLLLKPKLAYQAKRAPGQGVENLRRVLDPAIGMVSESRERFQNFVDFFEAILAYHRAHGGHDAERR